MVAGLQHFSNMPHNERQRAHDSEGAVLFGLCGQGDAEAMQCNSDIDANASDCRYYQMLGASIERDRDFEDLLRHHWGFAEVSTTLEDMRGKFAMVGLAYAFRKHLEQGMQYSAADLRGVFESLGSGAQSLEVYRLVEHVMRAPLGALLAFRYPSRPPKTLACACLRACLRLMGRSARRVGAGSGEVSLGKLSAQLPPPTEAPAEGGKVVALDRFRKASEKGEIGQRQVPTCAEKEGLGVDGSGIACLERLSFNFRKKKGFPRGRNLCRLALKTSLYNGRIATTRERVALDPSVDVGSWKERNPQISQARLHVTSDDRWWLPRNTVLLFQKLPQRLEEMLAPPERDAMASAFWAEAWLSITFMLWLAFCTFLSACTEEFGKLPLEDTTEAPPEDDDGLLAPEETDGDHLDEIPEAERHQEKWEATSTNSITTAVTISADGSYGSYGMYSADGFQQLYQPYSGYAYHLSGLGMAPMAPQPSQHVQISSGQAGQMVTSPSHQAAPSKPAKPETAAKLHVTGQRAVTVGVNYIGTEDFGFSVSDIRQLRDDHPRNISAALQWLVKGAAAGDHLLFHYSGHGSQRRDSSGDEADGKARCLVGRCSYAPLTQNPSLAAEDETIVPCDFNRSGMIADDELRRMLVDGLPKGCRLTVIMDCCRLADLKPMSQWDRNGPELQGGVAGNKAAGAMTTAFRKVISKKRDISRVPQLCMEFHLNFEEPFLPEVLLWTVRCNVPEQAGINYFSLTPGQGRLSGCINDSETMIAVLKETFKFEDGQICRLRDDRTNLMPTKALKRVVMGSGSRESEAETSCFCTTVACHGGRAADRSGDEITGQDDTLIPCDFQTAGQISDDELHSLLVEHLPEACRLWVLFDCCHSGTALDLAFKAEPGISEANAVMEMSDEDSGGRTTMPGRGQFLTRASSSTECRFIIEVSSEEDGEEGDLELIPASGGATATDTGSIFGPSSVLDRANSGSFSGLNTMD
ncbi:Metacaspase-1 [Symbiodinium microadriaticum]|uniref:Metacaspase-1 n=1 Tax=Symbiodinium microadriaticum TaxID=2951 RepID=A0A1Q9C7R8_SYMMI|nr:Metacaspase-1 [Symbiodinium microadriaticum]